MASGGYDKESFDTLYVELPENEAIEWFINKYGHNPNNVTCPCCGPDYSVYEVDKFEDSAFIITKDML